MFGIDDILVLMVAAAMTNLAVEVGVELAARWLAHSPDSPLAAEPISEQIQYVPELLAPMSAHADQTVSLSLRADEFNMMLGQALVWSEQMIGSLGSSIGL